MAYNKKTWKARQGIGLNKFSIDGATPVPITNQPDSVTQQGDALSAGNLNNLEDRIANAFDDVETEKADTSTTDDLQNQIINLNTSVETLDAIVGCEAEIENTDPSEGQSILASSRLIHHVNLLPSGEFGQVGARDVKFNQLIVKGNFPSDTTTEWLTSSATKSISNNVCTVTPSGSNGQLYQNFSYLKGHVYLAVGEVKLSSAVSSVRMIVNGTNVVSTYASANTSWQTLTAIMSESTGVNGSLIFRDNDGSTAFDVRNVNIFDLTAMDMASLTASQFRALFPASYYSYDAGSIINLNPTGFKIIGFNQFGGSFVQGTIDGNNGAISGSNYRVTSDMFNVIGGEKYSFNVNTEPSGVVTVFECAEYDPQQNFIKITTITGRDSSLTLLSNTAYIRVSFKKSNGNTITPSELNGVFCANYSGTKDGTYEPYSEQTVLTPQIADGHYVNENVYDYVTNKVVDGVLRGEVHTKVGVKTFVETDGWHIITGTTANLQIQVMNTSKASMLAGGYVQVSTYSECVNNSMTYYIGGTDNDYLYVNDPAFTSDSATKAKMNGLTFQFELPTESVTYGEPLRSFSVSDYCTIEPITPQTLPNRVDVPFSVLSKSNNGIIEQIAQNTADIAVNKAILSQHEARIANLEQVSGDYVTEDMQDYSTVPTGKASFALVETLKGVSRVENQLIKTLKASNASQYGCSWTNNGDGTLTVVGTPTTTPIPIVLEADSVSLGDYLLITGGKSNARLRGSSNLPYANAEQGAGLVIQAGNTNEAILALMFANTTDAVNVTLTPCCTNLNQYFNTSDLSFLGATDSAKLATIQSDYPELLEARDYNAGEIVDSTYTSVTSRGKNLFDIGWLLQIDGWALTGGYYTGAVNGNKDTINETLASLELDERQIAISIKGHNNASGNGLGIRFNYSDGTSEILYLSGTSDTTVLKVSNSAKTVTRLEMTYGSGTLTSYISEFQIEFGSSATAYSPYFTATLPIPSVTLKGAGSVYDTDELNVEVNGVERRRQTTKVGSMNLGLSDWTYNGTAGHTYFRTSISGEKRPSSGTAKANIICARFITESGDNVYNNIADKIIAIPSDNDIIMIHDSSFSDADAFKTSMNNVYLYYERVTYAETFSDPILDNTLRTEGGGTVYTNADVDGQFTLGFLNL